MSQKHGTQSKEPKRTIIHQTFPGGKLRPAGEGPCFAGTPAIKREKIVLKALACPVWVDNNFFYDQNVPNSSAKFIGNAANKRSRLAAHEDACQTGGETPGDIFIRSKHEMDGLPSLTVTMRLLDTMKRCRPTKLQKLHDLTHMLQGIFRASG